MSINRRESGLQELRDLAGQRQNGDGEAGRHTGPDVDDVPNSEFRAELYRELLSVEAGPAGSSKPYLDSLPDAFAGEHMIFEWLEYLLGTAGYQGTVAALDYYESVDWIAPSVSDALGDYLRGIDSQGSADPVDLSIDDHLLSLVYVSTLASMAADPNGRYQAAGANP